MKKLIGAIIGYGGLGKIHLANLTQIDDVEVVAICDIEESQFTKVTTTNQGAIAEVDLTHIRKYTDAKQMLEAEQLDFVVIALPTYLHEEYTVMALNKGLHVLCEKPMARSLEGCKNMIAAAKENGKLLSIGQTLRFHFPYKLIKEAYDTGKYGKLLRLTLSRNSYPPVWGWNNWFMKQELSGGAAMDLHVHDVDFINYLLGLPEAVVSEAYHVSSGFDCISSQYFYKDGPIVQATGDWNMPVSYGFRCDYIAVFEKAVITNDDVGLKVCTGDGVLRQEDFPEFTTEDKYFTEIAYFLHCIRDDAENEIVPMESTMQTIQLVTAEIEAAKTRKMVYFK